MQKPIERLTMFKIPKEEDRERALKQYKILRKTAVKVSQTNNFIHNYFRYLIQLLHPQLFTHSDLSTGW